MAQSSHRLFYKKSLHINEKWHLVSRETHQ
jgi:hypothetical protein